MKQTGQHNSVMDTILLAVSALLLAGGIVGFYYLEGQALPVIRAIGLLVSIGLAVTISGFTVRGRQLLRFFRNADIERRKVVWPTRQETVQTTIMVLIVTLIVAAILFLFDSMLSVIVRNLMSGS